MWEFNASMKEKLFPASSNEQAVKFVASQDWWGPERAERLRKTEWGSGLRAYIKHNFTTHLHPFALGFDGASRSLPDWSKVDWLSHLRGLCPGMPQGGLDFLGFSNIHSCQTTVIHQSHICSSLQQCMCHLVMTIDSLIQITSKTFLRVKHGP